ncbi:MAG: hypothetical protein PHQ22_01480 [Sulfuricurvum sp.]|nr:hypothetical protein [Sulfuricurvum sp.]MDD5385851.1 hypothetical protein [Sulfuricurvum sp.]
MKFEYDSNKSEANKENHGIDFDEAFDNGEDISEFVDWIKICRPNLEQKRVNLDLPVWMIEPRFRSQKARSRSSSDNENVFSTTFRKSKLSYFISPVRGGHVKP